MLSVCRIVDMVRSSIKAELFEEFNLQLALVKGIMVEARKSLAIQAGEKSRD